MFGRGREWEHVEGTILAEAVHKQRLSNNGQWYTRMKYVVEYRRPEADVNRVELLEPERFGTKTIGPLSKGMAAPLLVDPKSGEVRFDTDDPRINLKARINRSKRRDEDDFKRALDG